MANTSRLLPTAVCLAVGFAGCVVDVPEEVQGSPEYATDGVGEFIGDNGAAGAPAYDDGPTEVLVDKEPGAWASTVPWELDIQTGCVTNAGTNATVYAQKKQYSYLDRYKKQYWVSQRTYTLDDPRYNDNEQCSFSRFDQSVLKSYTDESAIITRLRLWHNNAGSAPGWYVEYALLKWSGAIGSGGLFMCTFKRWIYKDEVAEAPCCEAYYAGNGIYKCV